MLKKNCLKKHVLNKKNVILHHGNDSEKYCKKKRQNNL